MHFLIFGGVLYFLPAIIAALRHTHNATGILILNIFLGWTVVGWFDRAHHGALLHALLRLLLSSGMVKAETSPHKSRQSEHRWLPRDWMAGIALFAGTVCVVLWQNAHVAVLWDLSYILDSAARIAAGQMPYRDFPFVYPPLTFLIQAAIIRFAGRVYFHHVLYAAFVGGLGTVITWRIALRSLRTRIASAWAVTLLIAAPLTFLGIYSIVPIPEYDGDCAFSILVALWLLQRADTEEDDVSTPGSDLARGCAAGIAICLPMFFKQNMGLPFFVAAIGGGVARYGLSRNLVHRIDGSISPRRMPCLESRAARRSTLLASVLALHWTAGLGNYLYWTVRLQASAACPDLPPCSASTTNLRYCGRFRASPSLSFF